MMLGVTGKKGMVDILLHVREKPLHTVAVVIILKPFVSRRTAPEAKSGTDSAV